MNRRVNREGLALIKQWEGLKLEAYKCPAGVCTIGYGSTGSHVKPGLTITEQEAENLLRTDLFRFESAVSRLVKVELSDNQFSALVSLAYNIGEKAFARSSLLRKLNKGDYDSVPAELAKWVRAKRKVLPGLVNRRAAEAGLWAKGSFVTSREIVAQPKSDLLTPENIATGSGLVTAALGAANSSGPLQYALAAVVFVALTAAVVYGFKRLMEDRQ